MAESHSPRGEEAAVSVTRPSVFRRLPGSALRALFPAAMRRFAVSLVLAAACFGLAEKAGAVNRPQTLPLATARSALFNLVGQIFFTSGGEDYIGSGTVIKPYSVLTAGHNLYDPNSGWSTELEFRRGAYGASTLGDIYAAHIVILAGYTQAANQRGADSVATFAKDAGGLIFLEKPAGGAYAPYSANASLLQRPNVRGAAGYGAEQHSGDYPLYVTTTAGFYRTSGAFWENQSISIEGGMSGGPLVSRVGNGPRTVVGVVVSSSGPPEAGGVRVMDATLVSLIQKSLR